MSDERDILRRSVELRVPVFPRDTSAREKIDALEEHVLLSAYIRGDLAEARLDAYEALDTVEDKWVKMDGWDFALEGGRTRDNIIAAKRETEPETYDEMQRLKRRISRISEEMKRHDEDVSTVSRAYTMVTGS